MLSCKRLLFKPNKNKKKIKKNKKKTSEISLENDTITSQNNHHSHNLQQDDDEDDDDDDEFDASFNLKSSHNHGVQPLGNLYLSSNQHNCRDTGLGRLNVLSDELVLDILGLLGGKNLGVLSLVSKAFYVFCAHEPLWRNLVLEELKGGFLFNGSWRKTYIAGCCCSSLIDVSIFKSSGGGLVVRDFYSDYLFQSWLCANLEMRPEWVERDNIARTRGISVEEFVAGFEELNKPVLLEGCLENWGSFGKWDKDYLIRTCGSVRFSVGPVEMELEHYFRYSKLSREERPLYLFDPKFGEKVPGLGEEYEVPLYFREDLFSVLGDERPDYRWIIIGPAGSGSSFHIDPNSTSAWNAVIKGSKKWILFPPDVVPPGVHPSPDGAEVACPVSIIEWFMNFYDATKNWEKRPIECVCKTGEVIFVPNGWWHLVINLEESIAITQNFVSRRNLLNVLEFLKKPNASELVSGTRDRVNLHQKFESAIEASFPGTIDQLKRKAQEQQKKCSFWDTVSDTSAGAFKFSF